MSVNFESLSDVLKNQIRRKIILTLSKNGSVSYVDLMNLVGITNTGKFNYHLKILGDLIKKDESRKYSLSDKGQLAVNFLQKSVGKETEAAFLRMNIENLCDSSLQSHAGFHLAHVRYCFRDDFVSMVSLLFRCKVSTSVIRSFP